MNIKNVFKYAFIAIVLVVSVILYSCQKETMVTEEASVEFAENITDKSKDIEISTIFVYVCGEVNSPGVYELMEGSRICDAIEAAGDVTKKASIEILNLATLVKDGDKIYVPSFNEKIEKDNSSSKADDGKVNINIASKEELMSLPGIGSVRADAIISYRETNGSFEDITDIKKVSGIKEAAFLKIKNMISV